MYKVNLLNNIKSPKLELFDKSKYEVGHDTANAEALMLRSAKIHEMEFSPQLLCIARAGAGFNNIPIDRCAKEGIVVFNTPGANAEAVKELVICSLFLASRNIIAGANWVKSVADKGTEIPAMVEIQKAQYAGAEILGKTLGVIGLGAIGVKIANAARALGMNVLGYDPYMSEQSKKLLSSEVKRIENLDEIYTQSDYISINVPYMEATKHFINKETIAKMKKGVKIINAARAELVNDDDIITAIESGQVGNYVTDFPNAKTAGVNGIIAIPHLGASTSESEANCVSMAAQQIIDYIENGNITNSVNLPAANLPRSAEARICIIHDNKPEINAKIKAEISSSGAKVEETLYVAAEGKETAYALIDLAEVPGGLAEKLGKVEGVIKVRSLI
ncbi:MAG: 3-phosphoglycerate dehydrogenase family protein [Oscillospiraceae bacterium]|nr:3-phosphoglycerate dehydrogenase family protein [Oscillospiraceae bacterium]